MGTLGDLRKDIKRMATSARAKTNAWFFKTGKGQYGEGDVFVGLSVPDTREIAKKYSNLSFADTTNLLKSKIHEERLLALLVLVHNYSEGNDSTRKKIVDYYLSSTKYINNWDLVDLSASKILGKYLLDRPETILTKLAKSKDLWEKRIAIISTYEFIINERFEDTLRISKILLHDDHDLIHKAVGWMLREVGKRSLTTEERFLKVHYKTMPRTMLRYAIEKFPETKRKWYMKKP